MYICKKNVQIINSNFVKKIIAIGGIVLFIVLYSCNSAETAQANNAGLSNEDIASYLEYETEQSEVNEAEGQVIKITSAEFKELIYDYSQHPGVWVYKGTRPAVIDFYADWCRPCKILEPILDDLAKEFAGKVDFYKVDTQVEQELSYVFQVKSIPMVVFSPINGNPEATLGVLAKEEYRKRIQALILQ